MTTDKVLEGIKAWIVAKNSPALAGVNLYLQDEAGERVPPFVTLSDTGSEEHEVLRGVLTISVEAKLFTVPVEVEAIGDTHATNAAGHRRMADALYCMLADTTLINFLTSRDGLRCFDVRGTAPVWEPEDDMRATTFQMEVKACPR